MDFVKVLEKVFELLKHQELWLPLAVVVAFVGWLGFWFGRFHPRDGLAKASSTTSPDNGKATVDLAECNAKLEETQQQYDKLHRAIFAEESELWRLHPPQPFEGYANPINVSRPRIIVVANNKGGVGKTTLTGNLAAYFESKGKRVLLIDLDYQGSLTGWMIKAAGVSIPENQQHRLAQSNRLLDGKALEHWQAEVLGNAHVNQPGLRRTQLITADYTLTDHETKLMLRWLAEGGNPDVRYTLAKALLSKHVQDPILGFDVVLIDAPPRLTTGAIGALVAGTHLLVPTVLDQLSAETAGSFLRQVWQLRSSLNLGIELAGVVATMTTARPLKNSLSQMELDGLARIRRGLSQWRAEGHIFKADIQDVAAIRNRAGYQIPYFFDDKVRAMFDGLGNEISQRISL